MSGDQNDMTEAFLREVIALFRKYGKVELRTKVGGNVAKLFLSKLKDMAGADGPDLVVTKRMGTHAIVAEGKSRVSPIHGKSGSGNESITYDRIEALLKAAPKGGFPTDELIEKLGVFGGLPALEGLLKPFRQSGLVIGPRKSGKIRWASQKHRKNPKR